MKPNWSQIFGAEAWEWICRLGTSIKDPEEKKAFWEAVKAKKEADPSYDVFSDFPRDHAGLEVAPAPAPAGIVQRTCRQILEDIKRRNTVPARHGPSRERPLTEEQKQLRELVDLGAHNAPLCLWPRRREGA